MRFAVLGDTHLTSGAQERFSALEWTLEEIRKEGIKKVFIAGDFCHNAPFPYPEITALFKSFPELEVYILLGNHDRTGGVLSGEFISLDWVKVVDRPMLIDSTLPILLLPYQEERSLSEDLYRAIKEYSLRPDNYILISHADLMYGDVFYEDKGYFPVTPSELRQAGPRLTLLGHIHAPIDFPELKAHYCGSLYPISSNEWGLRRYGIFDEYGNLDWRTVKWGRFYWQERLLLLDKESWREKVKETIAVLEERFSVRSDWRSAIALSLNTFALFALSEDDLYRAFSDEGIEVDKMEIIRIDLGGAWSGLVDEFVRVVDDLCKGERDDIKWGMWRDEIVERGLVRFTEVLARLR